MTSILTTTELDAATLVILRDLLDRAFEGRLTDDDWDHALGGTHVLRYEGERLVAHASVVPRTLWVGDRRFAAGYVEAVAVAPGARRRGLGTEVMRALEPTLSTFELCALSSSKHRFYERLDWERWQGPTWVQTDRGRLRTPDEDDGILVWRTARTGPIDRTASLTCEERAGDDW